MEAQLAFIERYARFDAVDLQSALADWSSGARRALEVKTFGEVDVVYETDACGLYRLRIRSGGHIPTHVHRVMHETELVVHDGLLAQGMPVAAGFSVAWPYDWPHRYENASAHEQHIACIDCPKFVPADEIEVDARELRFPP